VAATVGELEGGGEMPLVARVLGRLGLESKVRVETRSRLPAGSGLGESSALAVALAAAALEALGRPADVPALAALLGPDRGLGASGLAAALHGGTVLASRGGEGLHSAPLAVDPARVEESLLLVDTGGTRAPDPSGDEAGEAGATGEVPDIGRALIEGRGEDAVGLMADEWTTRRKRRPAASSDEIDRVVDVARSAGGAAWACGPGPGGLVAVWAPPGDRGPGRREAVEAALAAAGLRIFPARVDLRGLDRA
jgi:galactokinase/mevalonate kinase-like predicted kinase